MLFVSLRYHSILYMNWKPKENITIHRELFSQNVSICFAAGFLVICFLNRTKKNKRISKNIKQWEQRFQIRWVRWSHFFFFTFYFHHIFILYIYSKISHRTNSVGGKKTLYLSKENVSGVSFWVSFPIYIILTIICSHFLLFQSKWNFLWNFHNYIIIVLDLQTI